MWYLLSWHCCLPVRAFALLWLLPLSVGTCPWPVAPVDLFLQLCSFPFLCNGMECSMESSPCILQAVNCLVQKPTSLSNTLSCAAFLFMTELLSSSRNRLEPLISLFPGLLSETQLHIPTLPPLSDSKPETSDLSKLGSSPHWPLTSPSSLVGPAVCHLPIFST